MTAEDEYTTRTIRVALAARGTSGLLAAVGTVAALVHDSSSGAVLIVLGLVVGVASQLVAGLAAYRIAMNRPWPKVRPLDDEDEW